MQNSKALLALLTLSAFISSSLPSPLAQAQSATAESSSAAVPTQQPMGLTGLNSLATQAQGMVDACNLQNPVPADDLGSDGSLVGSATGAVSSYAANKKKSKKNDSASAKSCYDVKTSATSEGNSKSKKNTNSSDYTCDMSCAPPDYADGGKCPDFYDDTEYQPGRSGCKATRDTPCVVHDINLEKWTTAETSIKSYISFLNYKASDCVKKNNDAIIANQKNYACKLAAIQKVASLASTQIGQTLNANNQAFGKMVQFTNQVGQQMKDIDEILGPDKQDPNSSKGLIGIEEELEKATVELTSKSVDFKKQAMAIKSETAKNKQTLESSRMKQVVDCMKGDSRMGANGSAMLCSVPVMSPSTDANGKAITPMPTGKYTKQSCGPFAYLRSLVADAALRNGITNTQKEKSDQDAAYFDGLVGSIEADLGAADKTNDDGSMLVGQLTSQADIVNKYLPALQRLDGTLMSEAGVNYNLAGNFQKIAKTCYAAGDNWKKQQLNSAASTFNTQKDKIAGETDTLNKTLSTGMLEANSRYGDAMVLLGASRKNISNQCVSADPDKMVACFDNVTTQMGYVLNGGGGVGVTSKVISGGSLVQGFGISCSGVKPCVDAFRNARELKKKQSVSATQATVDFVNSSKTTIDAQLNGFGSVLGQIQTSLRSQFMSMQNTLAKMGLDPSGEMKTFPAEKLEATKENGMPGPYQMPGGKGIESILSGATPGGLVNFNSSGIEELLKTAAKDGKKQAEDIAEKSKKYSDALKSLDEKGPGKDGAHVKNSCTKGDILLSTENGNDIRVANDSGDMQEACQEAYEACKVSALTDNPSLKSIALLAPSFDSGALNNTVEGGALKRSIDALKSDVNKDIVTTNNCSDIQTSCPKYVSGLIKAARTAGRIRADQTAPSAQE